MGFTVDGSVGLESRIAREMSEIKAAAVERVGAANLTALVLGGGYGRGEGGIHMVDGEERVYNDYDFFVLARETIPWESIPILLLLFRMPYRLASISGSRFTRDDQEPAPLSL